MTWELLLLLALLTYGSRIAALVFLPQMPPPIAAVLDRMPAPLFAGLAAQALLGPSGAAPPPVLAAALGAVVVTPLRSLPLCLVAGIGAYLVARLAS